MEMKHLNTIFPKMPNGAVISSMNNDVPIILLGVLFKENMHQNNARMII